MPQGWAMHTWKMSLAGNSAGSLLPSTVVLVLLGGIFFLIGLTKFRRRFS